MSAIDTLMTFVDQDDPWAAVTPGLADIRLEAARERFEQQRRRIPALRDRADLVGVQALRTREDLVPLLFAHQTYKSYPESFLTDGRWGDLLRWLGTIADIDVAAVDVTGATTVDEWIECVERAGYRLATSSGTSKISFLPEGPADSQRVEFLQARPFGWPGRPVPLDNDRVYCNLGSRQGSAHFGRIRYFARPGKYFGFEKPRFNEMLELDAMRAKIREGSATPSMFARWEEADLARSRRQEAELRSVAAFMIENVDQPMVGNGPWNMIWGVVTAARQSGFHGRTFNPTSAFQFGGGTKGAKMPDNYKEEVADWLYPAKVNHIYGMVEVSSPSRMCEKGFYHPPPWVELLVLDEAGETVAPVQDGHVVGRVAYFDPTYECRWGGIVTGDQATVRYGVCSCGRPGPVIEDSIRRYAELRGGADDKLTCAAMAETYIRGLFGD